MIATLQDGTLTIEGGITAPLLQVALPRNTFISKKVMANSKGDEY